MSIALPAISSGIFGVPIPICAKAMMEGIRAFSSTNRSNQLQSITIMLLQEQHITTFIQAAGVVLRNIVHTADNIEVTASGKQMKMPTATVTHGDSDDEVQEVDQSMGQLLPAAPVTHGDSDDEVLDLNQSLRQQRPSKPVTNGENPIDVDTFTCKQSPAPYWIQDLELRQQDKTQLIEESWLTDKHINASNKLLKQQCPNQNGLYRTHLSWLKS